MRTRLVFRLETDGNGTDKAHGCIGETFRLTFDHYNTFVVGDQRVISSACTTTGHRSRKVTQRADDPT